MSFLPRILRARTLVNSFLALGLFFAFGVLSASAASVYDIVETTGTVGTNRTLELEYTIDTAVQTWADADTLTVTLPNNFPIWDNLTFTVENDGDANNNATAETAITAGAGNGQYTDNNGRILTIKYDLTTWGAVNNGAETIRILITAANLPTFANATTTVTWGGATVAADTNPSGTDTINISAGTLTSTSITPASTSVGATGNVTISFTTTTAIVAQGRIVITFPSGFDLSDFGTSQTPTSATGITAANWSATRSGQVVTMTENNTGATNAGAISFTLANIRNPSSTGSTGTYTVTTQLNGGSNDIDTNASITASTIVGSSSTYTVGTPEGVSVVNQGGAVVITWTDPDDDTTHIQILKGTDPLPVDGSVYATVAVGEEMYTDTDVEEGDVVTYQLRAYGSGRTGTLTEEVSLTVSFEESDDTTDDTSDDTTDDSTDDTSDDTTDDSTDDTSDEEDSSDDIEEDVEFSDVSSSHWAAAAIEVMVQAGVVEGYEDGTFGTDENLNRAEAAALLWRIVWVGEPYEVTADPFEDVEMSAWYAGYVNDLLDEDLVEGNPDGTYQPSEEINRAEFLQLAMNVYLYLYPDMEESADEIMDGEATDMFADLDTAAWYEGVVTVAAEWEFVNGSACDEGTCFNASNSITRAEATQMLYNIFGESL